MKALIFAGALALLASPALAVPYCQSIQNGPHNFGFGATTEAEAAAQLEMELNAEGIGAHQSRFWNGCLQTWVSENGQDIMRFFDPTTLREIPVD